MLLLFEDSATACASLLAAGAPVDSADKDKLTGKTPDVTRVSGKLTVTAKSRPSQKLVDLWKVYQELFPATPFTFEFQHFIVRHPEDTRMSWMFC